MCSRDTPYPNAHSNKYGSANFDSHLNPHYNAHAHTRSEWTL